MTPFLIAAFFQAAAPAPLVFNVDAGHTIVEFSIGFALGRIKGRFPQSHGTIVYDTAHVDRSSVSVVIESKSIDTGWPHRDEHLRTSDFFDVERFPSITFQSEKLRRANGKDRWIADGQLTMHGVTKPVSIPFHITQPPVRSELSNWLNVYAEGAIRLAREDFGITGGSKYNSWFSKARAATMADSVDVSIEIEGYLQDDVSQRTPNILGAAERMKQLGVDAYLGRLKSIKDTSSASSWSVILGGQDLVARALLAQNRLPEALAFTKGIAEMWPSMTRAHIVRGYALARSGDARGAAAEYARAKEVAVPDVQEDPRFPQLPDVWYWIDVLVRGAIEQGHNREALQLARVNADLYPKLSNAHTTLGLALAMNGDRAGATEAYAAALRVDPNDTRALALMRR
jgi:polyisoprenoid-binding protein YceI/predicted negative regulator of RcsB-dependent stress response